MTKITVQRGEYTSYRFTLEQDGVAVDLTNAAVYFVVRTTPPAGTITDDTDAVISKSVGDGIVSTSPSSGIIDVIFYPEDTADLSMPTNQDKLTYFWGMEVVLGGEIWARSAGVGAFIITHDVVRTI